MYIWVFCVYVTFMKLVQGRIQGGVLEVKTPPLFGNFFQFARVF